ncbi:MAG: hypothetical protein PUF31_02485 [Oscillospiraceae bacterium]|nr:hypothetical protein [Oscillospiraceae bacterium]
MKKQLRKGLSLFLAVMMLMSAWVWVAPEKAEAAEGYNYEVKVVMTDGSDGWDKGDLKIYGKSNNGQGSETQIGSKTGLYVNQDSGTYSWYTGTSTSFPSKLTYQYQFGGGFTWRSMAGTLELYVGEKLVGSQSFSAKSSAFSAAKGTVTLTVASANYPSISTITPNNPIELTAPKFGTTNTSTGSATFSATDNFGVAWKPALSFSSVYVNKTSNASSNLNTSRIKAASSGNKVTVTAYNGIQYENPGESKGTFYAVVRTSNGTVGYTTITVNNPTYTVRFHPNGGVIGEDENNAVSDSTTPNYIEYTSEKYYYGSKIGNAPALAQKEGMDLLGFYKDKKDNSYDLVRPTYTGGFKDGDTKIDDRGDGQAWYAAWGAKPITATFRNADGQVIGTLTGRWNTSLRNLYGADSAINEALYKAVDTATKNKFFNATTKDPIYNVPGVEMQFKGWKVYSAKDLEGNNYDTIEDQTAEAVLKGDVVFIAEYDRASAKKYTVTFYNTNGNVLTTKADYNYRDNVIMPATEPTKAADTTYTYEFKGWAMRAGANGVKYHVINAEGIDDNVAMISYLSKDTASFVVRDNAEYIPVFEKHYIDYTINFNYYDDGKVQQTATITSHFGDIITAPAVKDNYTYNGYRYALTGWTYGASSVLDGTTACSGNMTFTATYDSGTPAVYTINFFDRNGILLNPDNNQYTHNSAVTAPEVPMNEDDYDYHYTFAGWSPAVTAKATKDVDYYAQYSKTPYYDVSFYNGTELVKTDRLLEGSTIVTPAEDPTKAEDMIGTYTFTGWADKDGNPVTTVSGNTKLYAQYSTTYKEYTVTFKNDDGTVLSTAKYRYNDTVDVPEATKEADNTFTYAFAGWDTDVAAKCKGDATYTATYKKSYIYYQIQWLNDDGSLYKKENYTYNARILAPTTDPTPIAAGAPDTGYSWILAGWQNVDTGVMYKRGDRITGNGTYKAVFEQAASICTIELYEEDGITLYRSFKAKYDTAIDADLLGDGPVSEGDEARDGNHVAFDKWVTLDGSEIPAVLQSDLKLKATYKTEKHAPVLSEVTTPPTFFVVGKGIEECSCGRTWEVDIPVIEDHQAPTIKTYIGQRYWDQNTTDFGEVFEASPTTAIIFNADDKAERSKYNPLADKGAGVATISFSVQQSEIDPATIADGDWTVRYDYTQVSGEVKEANASGRLGNLGLENGVTYIVYAKAVDRKGNTSYARTGTFYYDDVAPVIEVKSSHQYNSKHCLDATITVTDDKGIASITLDGVAITDNLTVTAAGLHEVIAVDNGGNITKAVFEIVGEHKYKAYTIAATCTEDGKQFERCTLCGDETAGIAIPATGHDFQSFIYTAPTCTENGYKTYVCSNGCGAKDIVYDDPATTTGEHTYGEWIIDEAATCKAPGSQHKVCSKCSDVVYEEIPVDTENGHKWYRPVVTKPTCTDDGYTTRTCRYCGVTETYDIVAATGHTASGEWVITVPATCTAEGTQVQYCANCDTTEVQKTEQIPALGHKYIATVVEPTQTEQGYTLYKCARCGDEYKDNYVDPVKKFTVTFFDEDKTTQLDQKTELLTGETITAADIVTPTKAADATYKYTFDHWADAEGNEIAMPITVTGDMNVYAVYATRYINYTVTLYKEDGTTQFKKVGYQHYGDTLTVANGPDKASDSMYDYTFAGWKAPGAEDSTASFDIKITGDLDLVAAYTAKLREYNVVFAYDAENVIKTVKVQAGGDATELAPTDVTKAYDSVYHYEFDKWNTELTDVQKDLYVNPIFKAIAHTGVPSIKQKADCTNPEITTYTCTCGYTYDKETKAALGHDLTDAEHFEDETGYYLICNRCGEKILDTTIFSATFLNGDKTVKTVGYLKFGQYLTADQLPAEPTKAEDAKYTYAFSHWALADDDTDTAIDPTTVKITANVSFKACFTATLKTFTVVFAIDSDHVVKVFKNVEAGQSVTCDITPEPLTKYDDYGHYVFDGWSRDTSNVSEDLYVTAKFKKVDHVYTTSKTEATCTVGAGTTYTCDCGFRYTVSTGKPLGHNWIAIESKEPSYEEEGYIKYQCDRCGETKTEVLPDKDYIFINITLVDQDGAPVQGATVSLYYKGEFVTSGITDQNGKVTLVVEEAKDYTIVISGEDVDTVTADVTVNGDGSIDMSRVPTIKVNKCTCTCHRNGLWPTIFRFFHKIIKMLVGEFKCCNNPDARYYN